MRPCRDTQPYTPRKEEVSTGGDCPLRRARGPSDGSRPQRGEQAQEGSVSCRPPQEGQDLRRHRRRRRHTEEGERTKAGTASRRRCRRSRATWPRSPRTWPPHPRPRSSRRRPSTPTTTLSSSLQHPRLTRQDYRRLHDPARPLLRHLLLHPRRWPTRTASRTGSALTPRICRLNTRTLVQIILTGGRLQRGAARVIRRLARHLCTHQVRRRPPIQPISRARSCPRRRSKGTGSTTTRALEEERPCSRQDLDLAVSRVRTTRG